MFEIINDTNGTKWTYYKQCGHCFRRYYEFFKSYGWKAHTQREEISQDEYTEKLLEHCRDINTN